MWGWGETNSCMLLEGVRDCRCTESSLEPEEEELEASGAAAEWAGEEAGASPRGVCKAPSFHPQSKALPAEGSQIRRGGVRGPAHGCLGVSTFPSWPAGRMELQFTESEGMQERAFGRGFGFLLETAFPCLPAVCVATWVSSSQWRLEGLCAASMQQKWNLERKMEFFRSLETNIFTITLLSYELKQPPVQ